MPTDPSRFAMEQGPLGDATKEIAEKELRETPEQREESLAALRTLLAAEKGLRYKTDDDFLLRFLRPTKFYPESALALMKRAADFKVTYASHVKDLVPSDVKDAFLDHTVCNVLVDRDHLGRRMLIVSCGSTWDPKKVSSDQLFRMFYLIHLAAMLEPETQICGVVVILDFNNLSMKQVAGLSPSFCMRLLSFIQDAMPLRMKGAHIVMQPFLFNMVFAMFKPFIREKLKKRMFFHGKKMESLHQHIPADFLPSDYGGTKPALDYSSKDWYPAIEACEGVIRAWGTMGRCPVGEEEDTDKDTESEGVDDEDQSKKIFDDTDDSDNEYIQNKEVKQENKIQDKDKQDNPEDQSKEETEDKQDDNNKKQEKEVQQEEKQDKQEKQENNNKQGKEVKKEEKQDKQEKQDNNSKQGKEVKTEKQEKQIIQKNQGKKEKKGK